MSSAITIMTLGREADHARIDAVNGAANAKMIRIMSFILVLGSWQWAFRLPEWLKYYWNYSLFPVGRGSQVVRPGTANPLSRVRIPAAPPILLLRALFLFDRFFDGSDYFRGVWLLAGFETLDRCTVSPNQKLSEVPFDVTREGSLVASKSRVEFVLLWTFLDDYFVEHGEGDVEAGLAELLDFFVPSGFLSAEVVARKAEDGETLALVFTVNGFQLLVLFSKPAL